MHKGFVIFLIVIIFFSCTTQFEDDYKGALVFSSDTVSFDTIFTEIGSVTKSFKVINLSAKELLIDELQLRNDEYFTLNVDGVIANFQQNVTIPPNDSIYIFVQSLINYQDSDKPVVIENSIDFFVNSELRSVCLLAYGQDVNIVKSEVIESDTIWRSKRPYLIMDSLTVLRNSTLYINEGSVVYFYKNAKMNIFGCINAVGTIDKPIVFRGHRLDRIDEDYQYDQIAGQWMGIRVFPSTKASRFENCIIRNAINAIDIGSEYSEEMGMLDLQNVIVHNSSNIGLYAFNSKINAGNCQISNSGMYNVIFSAGGNYSFVHCTISNFYGYDYNAKREELPCLAITNAIQIGNYLYYNNLSAMFYNCIVDGSFDNEVVFQMTDLAEFNFLFENSFVKINESILTDFPESFVNSFMNEKIEYVSVDKFPYNFSPDTNSFVINKGNIAISNRFNLVNDINGNSRIADGMPDLGAYEFLWE